MPNFHYTIHAHTAMNEREILHEWVEETLENPEHCAEDPKDSDLRRFYRHIPDFEILNFEIQGGARALARAFKT